MTILTTPIQARNILLLSLIIDDGDQKYDLLWSIYFHFYFDKDALTLLRLQAKKLHKLSRTMETWRQSKYGSHLKFCDSASLADVREMWGLYGDERKGTETQSFERRLENALEKAREQRRGSAVFLTAFRAAIPAHLDVLTILSNLNKHYWKYGSIDLKEKDIASAKHPNPMFLTLDDESTIHYGTDPLTGFHIAAAIAPLRPDSRWFKETRGLSQQERLIAVAREEFRNWVLSYKESFCSVTLRFCVANALAFAHTLQHRRTTGADQAGWHRDQNQLQPLVLDGPDYASNTAPLTFDIIDTSNVGDHLGALCLLTATSPLLRNQTTSALYTETIAKHHGTHQEIIDNMLCGHVPTLSTLVGLFPVEYWTNTSSLSYGDENVITLIMKINEKETGQRAKILQMYLRTCWKRPMGIERTSNQSRGLSMIQFDPKQLARLLYKVYKYMFRNEDPTSRSASTSIQDILESSLVWYHRASFAAFIRLVKTRVTCDWDATIDALMELIVVEDGAPLAMHYLQELFVYLHILDVFSVDAIREWHNRDSAIFGPGSMYSPILPDDSSTDEKWDDLRDWKDVPPVVCVTLKVPRRYLTILTSMKRGERGVPTVRCLIQGASSGGMDVWLNIFLACQLTFGDVTTSGNRHSGTFRVSIPEDRQGWSGTSALVASFYVPSSVLLEEPRRAEVALGIHGTPVSAANFIPKLGREMNIYETTLDNYSNVYITQYAPNLTVLPAVPGFAEEDMVNDNSLINPGVDTSLIASVDEETGHITTFTTRFDSLSDHYKSILRDGCQVRPSTLSPCQFSITLGQKQALLTMSLPVFSVESTGRTRIARKSSYVEHILQVAGKYEWMNYPYFMYPVFLQQGKPVLWNLPYTNLRHSPIVDVTRHSELEWLDAHFSLAGSARERRLRNSNSNSNIGLPGAAGERTRLQFKESVFSIFRHFAGIRDAGNEARGGGGGEEGEEEEEEGDGAGAGRRRRQVVFGLHNPDNGGTHVVIAVSAVRLDPASRAAVLDCAVVPLHAAAVPALAPFLNALLARGFARVPVDDALLRLWKHALPAFAERCRTWEHRAGACEYARAGAVPLTCLDARQFMCTCGNGHFPPGFIGEEGGEGGVPLWRLASRYAVRAAISPSFWAPFADELYQPDESPSTGSGGDTELRTPRSADQ